MSSSGESSSWVLPSSRGLGRLDTAAGVHPVPPRAPGRRPDGHNTGAAVPAPCGRWPRSAPGINGESAAVVLLRHVLGVVPIEEPRPVSPRSTRCRTCACTHWISALGERGLPEIDCLFAVWAGLLRRRQSPRSENAQARLGQSRCTKLTAPSRAPAAQPGARSRSTPRPRAGRSSAPP